MAKGRTSDSLPWKGVVNGQLGSSTSGEKEDRNTSGQGRGSLSWKEDCASNPPLRGDKNPYGDR